MRVAFHGATTMTSDLETDVRVTAGAGFKALELWATKVDKYLESHSVSELKALLANNHVAPMTFNSIEFIAFRGAEFEAVCMTSPDRLGLVARKGTEVVLTARPVERGQRFGEAQTVARGVVELGGSLVREGGAKPRRDVQGWRFLAATFGLPDASAPAGGPAPR